MCRRSLRREDDPPGPLGESRCLARQIAIPTVYGAKIKTEASLPPFLFCDQIKTSSQPSRRMREQGIDQTRLRGEVAPQDLRSALVARDFVEQALELGDVAVDGLLEIAVGAIFAGDFVERLLAGRGVKPFCKSLALAALVAIPHLGGEISIHQAADVEGQRLQRV